MLARVLFVLLLALPTFAQELAGLQWRFETGGAVNSTPAILGDTIYAGSGDGHLYAVDRRTGAQRWKFDAGSGVASSPKIAGGTVYFTSRTNTLFAVDATSGAPRWRVDGGADLPLSWGHESGDHFLASPVLDGTNVLFAAGDGIVRQVDAAGTIRWQTALGERIRATPTLAGGRVFVGTANGHIVALDAQSGTQLWKFATDGVTIDSSKFGFDRHTIQSSPAVADGTVVTGARDGKIYALDAASGRVKWTQSHGTSWIITSPAIVDGTVYLGSSDAGFVQALQLSDGKEVWKSVTQSPVWSSPAIAGDTLYTADFLGRLHAIDRRTGQQRWFFRAGAHVFAGPLVDGNRIYFGSNDGALYALRTGPAKTHRASFIRREGDLVKVLTNRGYTALADDAALKAFLDARTRDREPSVVVIAVADPQGPGSKVTIVPDLQPYLRAGGKVVWVGHPPNLWKPDPQSLLDVDFAAPARVIGVDHSGAIFDPRATRATAAGRRWGLAFGLSQWRDDWGVAPALVDEVLALDDWGLATSWGKRYGGAPGTGFVRVPAEPLASVYFAAEYRPE